MTFSRALNHLSVGYHLTLHRPRATTCSPFDTRCSSSSRRPPACVCARSARWGRRLFHPLFFPYFFLPLSWHCRRRRRCPCHAPLFAQSALTRAKITEWTLTSRARRIKKGSERVLRARDMCESREWERERVCGHWSREKVRRDGVRVGGSDECVSRYSGRVCLLIRGVSMEYPVSVVRVWFGGSAKNVEGYEKRNLVS